MLVTEAEIKEQLKMIREEQKALLDKMPVWKKVAVFGVLAAAIAAAIAVCGALTAASGGVAIAGCVAAMLVALGALLKIITDIADEDGEADQIQAKYDELEALKESLS